MPRFVFTYTQSSEPSKKEEAALLTALTGASVLARIPGLLRIECDAAIAHAAAKAYPKWSCHPERHVGTKSSQ